MAPFETTRVERMARDIIANYGLPLDVVMTVDDGSFWRLVVRDASHRVIDLHVTKTELATELREQLTTQLNAVSP